MNKPYGWVDEINTFVLDKDYRQLPKSLQNGMTPLYANKVPDGLIDPKSYYIGYEDGKKAPQTKPLSDEEIYELWCESDNTELLPEMRNKDGSINYIILTFAQLLLDKASEK